MQWTIRKLFLVDSMGALLSAFLLGVVLVRFESAIGMPRAILYFLSSLACLLALSSGTSYWLAEKNGASYLKIIAWANLLYCCLTASLVLYHYSIITALGRLYFLAEIGVIAALAYVELKAAAAKNR